MADELLVDRLNNDEWRRVAEGRAMSYARVVYLYCDPCRDNNADYEPFRVDPPAAIMRGDGGGTAEIEREDAAKAGWHYVKGRDICDQCWEAGKR